MKYSKNEGKEYIKKFPHLKKWINVCICCGTWGYKPELPDYLYNTKIDSTTACAQNIRRYFNPLQINELGICEDCQRVLKHHSKE